MAVAVAVAVTVAVAVAVAAAVTGTGNGSTGNVSEKNATWEREGGAQRCTDHQISVSRI